ncbi:UNVERIFIED_CONTAM: hypothetical protein GTU68_049283, partial [Idotea baltica]|nr:hypothetical protein [Idotea baltica]
DAYLRPLKLKKFDSQNSEITLSAPSKFVCQHADDKFRDKISSILEKNYGINNLNLKFSVNEGFSSDENSDSKPVIVIKNKNKQEVRKVIYNNKIDNNLDPKYTFDNFIVGNSNEFSHAAAKQVGESPGQTYNPLFIYGGVGLGKTHLLHAIGNYVVNKFEDKRVLYMSSEEFTNELIFALRNGKMESFKTKLRSINLLLIDDIQFISGKERTQEEFFHTFNAIYGANNQIIITSDKLPQQLPGIEERLRTRFSWGLTADLQAPDFETRVAILKKKAMNDNFKLNEEVAHYIGKNIASNVRELEGALTKVYAYSCLRKTDINIEIAELALKQVLKPKKINVSIKEIKIAVADYFNLKVVELISKRRTRRLSFPRHIAMYLCRKHTTASYPEIGREFGGRDHSSVIHAANVVSKKIKLDEDLLINLKEIEKDFLDN